MTKKTVVDIEPIEFADHQLTYDLDDKKRILMSGSSLTVSDIVGPIEKGMKRFGFTAGQFSMGDIIEYILYEIGPSDLYLSTWAASSDGLKKVFHFLKSEQIRNIRFMIDSGAKRYRDEGFASLLDRFGDCIRTTRIHAKFVVIRNEKFDLVIRTSANLNRNTRLENFEIDEDKEFADFFQKYFDIAFDKITLEESHTVAASRKLGSILDDLGDNDVFDF